MKIQLTTEEQDVIENYFDGSRSYEVVRWILENLTDEQVKPLVQAVLDNLRQCLKYDNDEDENNHYKNQIQLLESVIAKLG